MSDRIHKLKTHPQMFADLRESRKRFEVRRDDRGFRIGDVLELHEWPVEDRDCMIDHVDSSCMRATQRIRFSVTYILRGGEWGIEPGYVVMGLIPLARDSGGSE